MLIIPPAKSHRRREPVLPVTSSPPSPPPPPPPPPAVTVDNVIPWGGDANVAIWIFSMDVQDPTSAEAAGLAIDGAAGGTWEREDFNALRVMYPAEVLVGQPWTCAAGAAGIQSVEGGALDAGAGEVNTPG